MSDGGRDVVMAERDAGHDAAMWRAEFPQNGRLGLFAMSRPAYQFLRTE